MLDSTTALHHYHSGTTCSRLDVPTTTSLAEVDLSRCRRSRGRLGGSGNNNIERNFLEGGWMRKVGGVGGKEMERREEELRERLRRRGGAAPGAGRGESEREEEGETSVHQSSPSRSKRPRQASPPADPQQWAAAASTSSTRPSAPPIPRRASAPSTTSLPSSIASSCFLPSPSRRSLTSSVSCPTFPVKSAATGASVFASRVCPPSPEAWLSPAPTTPNLCDGPDQEMEDRSTKAEQVGLPALVEGDMDIEAEQEMDLSKVLVAGVVFPMGEKAVPNERLPEKKLVPAWVDVAPCPAMSVRELALTAAKEDEEEEQKKKVLLHNLVKRKREQDNEEEEGAVAVPSTLPSRPSPIFPPRRHSSLSLFHSLFRRDHKSDLPRPSTSPTLVQSSIRSEIKSDPWQAEGRAEAREEDVQPLAGVKFEDADEREATVELEKVKEEEEEDDYILPFQLPGLAALLAARSIPSHPSVAEQSTHLQGRGGGAEARTKGEAA
ncbi:hypothetical protein JCM11251_005620 [Rhodosporidiobolus azoricus]